ncbi:MAG: ABC transporter ATP-binding protein [Tenericutes bacterium]|nr:ABC transporter ATP-binding protein [Mycoplasmatota bacterium]
MIKINKLTKYYDKTLGVKDLSLEVKKGEVFGFIGPNGAGKSTTIRCIMNLINKNEGEVFIDNEINDPSNILLKSKIGYLPSEINLYDDMTVKEMINYSKSFYNKDLNKRIKYLLSRFKLEGNKKIKELSYGNLKKLAIVITFMHDPEILILDEATNGLDPLMQNEFYELIKEEKKKGKTVFISTHNLSEIKKICDRVGIIRKGKLIKVSDVSLLSKDLFSIVYIESDEINKINFKYNIIESNNKSIKFIYSGEVNELLKKLSKINIKRITIEEPSVEDVFKHYYK